MIRKLFSFPGLIVIAILYFMPVEYGKQRNTVRGARWWKYKDEVSLIISIIIYLSILAILILLYNKEIISFSNSVLSWRP